MKIRVMLSNTHLRDQHFANTCDTLALSTREHVVSADIPVPDGWAVASLSIAQDLRDDASKEGASREDLIRLLGDAARIVAIDIEDLGPCDHSVGVCYCGMRRLLEDMRAVLPNGDVAPDGS